MPATQTDTAKPWKHKETRNSRKFKFYRTMYGRTGFEGVAQAKAVIFFIIVAVVAFIQNRITTSKEVEA